MAKAPDREIRSLERIQRIIGILRLDGREVELHLPFYIEIAKISNTSQDTFTLKLSNPLVALEKELPEHVYIGFVFSGVELFGRCKFAEQSRSFITLEYPESLMSRTKRKHPRVRPERAITAEVKYREQPESKMERIASREVPVKYSQLFWEAQRESVDIKKIFLMGIKEIKAVSPYSELMLYNKDNMNSRDARIMRKSGKVLFIDDCTNSQAYTRLIASDKLITYSYFVTENKQKGASREELLKQLREIITEDRAQRWSSKVIIPLFSKDRVIGHIKVSKNAEQGKLSSDEVNDLIALAKLMGLGIEKARYIPNISDMLDSSLVNISEGGILLKIENHTKGVNIPEGVNIEVKFQLNEKEVTLKGNICRKNLSEQLYAIRLLDMMPDDRKLIKNFIDEKIAKLRQGQ